MTPICTDGPPGVAQHSLADLMPDQYWADRPILAYGETTRT
ncbi:hypothetical protein [Streptomyces sp. NPDC002853]